MPRFVSRFIAKELRNGSQEVGPGFPHRTSLAGGPDYRR